MSACNESTRDFKMSWPRAKSGKITSRSDCSNLLAQAARRAYSLFNEDLVHVGRGAPKYISKVRPIGHKAPGIDKLPQWVHPRQPVLGRQVREASSLAEDHVACQPSQSTRARPGHVREGPAEIGGPSRLNELKPHPQRLPRDFCSFQHVPFRAFARATWLPEDSDPSDPRNGLLELLQTLAD